MIVTNLPPKSPPLLSTKGLSLATFEVIMGFTSDVGLLFTTGVTSASGDMLPNMSLVRMTVVAATVSVTTTAGNVVVIASPFVVIVTVLAGAVTVTVLPVYN